MTVRVLEIETAPTAPMVELAVVGMLRAAAVGESGLLDALEDGVELGVAHVKGVVMACEAGVVIEQERRLVVDAHRSEVVGRLAFQAEDLREEAGGLLLVACRNDGVVEDDGHGRVSLMRVVRISLEGLS